MARSRNPVDRVFDAIVPRAVDAVDPGELIERIDVDAVIGRVDVDALVQRVDIEALLERIDIDALIGRVDVDGIVQRVDIDALMTRVDVDALMARVDVNALMGRVDVNVLLSQVDLNALMAEVDVKALAARAGIDQIVADATSGIAARTLDLARRQILGLDTILLGLVDRLLRRPRPTVAPSPRPAGPLARFVGFVLDSAVVSVLFSAWVFLMGSLVALFTQRSFSPADDGGLGWALAFLGWWFAYLWLSLAIAGRTVGKGVVGLRVVAADGTRLRPRAAALRALVLPLSFVGGLGFIPAVVGRSRRALHDHLAGSAEIVDWGAREATLPAPMAGWLAEQAGEGDVTLPGTAAAG